MSSRKVVTRRGRRFRGYFPSRKLDRMVAWESLLELDAIRLLEFSRGVVSYREQPAIVRYFDGSMMRDYYPDFEVELNDGTRAHLEVKMLARLEQQDTKTKFAAIAGRYAELGQAFRIVTEREIRREPLLRNVKTLSYLAGRHGDRLPERAEVAAALGPRPVSLGAVQNRFGAEIALRLIAHGLLACDLELALTSSTLVNIVEGGGHATVLL